MALVNGGHSVLFWGWPLCTRTTYRFLEHYEKVPRVIRAIQTMTPFFKSGKDRPILECEFMYPIESLKLGCGFINAVDTNNNVYSWGDNYAGQLGTGDDIHRDEPTLI